MTNLTLSRRDFLKGCCATAAVGAVGPTMLFSSPAHAGVNPYDTIVHVFLRGAIDGLNLVVPIAGEDRTFYEQARPKLVIPATGAYAALPLTLGNGAQTGFGLHPSASGLRDLWNDRKLAIVHNCGLLTKVTRSHFDAQLYLDLGTPGQLDGSSGWLTRAWSSHPNQSGTETMPTLAINSRAPASLLGSTTGIAMASPTDFALNAGAYQWQRARTGSPAGFQGVNETIEKMWAGSEPIEQTGTRANNALKVIAQQTYGTLPVGWPTSKFARQLWTVAQSIRFNLGVRYATLDLGGWDTHVNQGTAGTGSHYFQNKIAELSQALSAFYAELALGGEAPRVTVVVQSEFGRRVRQNGSNGTDHGYGNPLLVLGGPVNGRRFHGSWLGLDPEVLQPYFGDVPITTDYRRVLSELLIRRMGNNRLSTVFPGYSGYAPLGVVQGTDMTPQIAGIDSAQEAVARLPHHPQPRVGESLEVEAPDVPTPDWQKRGKVERMLIRRGL